MSDISTMDRSETNIDIFMAQRGIRRDKELAEKIGWTPSDCSQKLSGSISIKTLKKLAEFFEVPVKEMFR